MGGAGDAGRVTTRGQFGVRRYNFQTVFPPTIVRTARPFQFPAVERRVARQALAGVRVHRPFQLRIDQRHIGRDTGRECPRLQLQQARRIDREHLDQSRQIDRLLFVHEQIDEQSELRLQSDDAKRRLIELHFLLKFRVRRMIARQDVERAVGDAFEQRRHIFLRAQRRIHLVVRVEILDRFVGQRDVMRTNFAADFHPARARFAQQAAHCPRR